MSDLYEQMLDAVDRGEQMAVATIVGTRGSTPREVGARMLVRPDGTIKGTIGGGCGEADVWATAMQVLESGEPQMVDVDLLSDTDGEGGRACGGIMRVFVEPLLSLDVRPKEVQKCGTGDEGTE